MEIIRNYTEYRKNKPKYAEWKQKRNETQAKKEQYLKDNPVSDKEKQRAIQKANIILNTVDTLDEFSQSKAENTEVATDAISSAATLISLAAGMGIGAIFMATKGGKAKMNAFTQNHPKLKVLSDTLPEILGSLATLPVIAPVISWATKNQILASKIGRHEAITTELNSVNRFAILDENQLQELNKTAESIEIKDETNKDKVSNGFKEAKATIDNLANENLAVQKHIKAQNEQFENEKQNFDKPLTKEEIKNAKEEQQMITQITEAIDTASQDYAEDVEFGASLLAVGGGLLGASFGFITKGIGKLIGKNKNAVETAQKAVETAAKASKGSKISKLFPAITGLLGMLIAGIITTKIEKQASRVARFKVMQDFKNNPEKLIYVEDDKLKDIKVENQPKKEKEENLFSFFVRLFKENKEYNDYIKQNGKKEKQLNLARNKIKLTEKQKMEAQQLQQNIFKAFNKIDDKSQTYSESTEALGSIIKEYGNEIASDCGMLISMLLLYKNKGKAYSAKNMLIALLPIFLTKIPGIVLNAFITSEQKKSSRVAHMLAMNELEDFRHFANYNTSKKELPLENSSSDKTPEKTPQQKELPKNPSINGKEPGNKEANANLSFQNIKLDKAFSKFV